MAAHLVECYIDAREYSTAHAWKLVQWCHQQGADEWTAVPAYRFYPGNPFEQFAFEMQPFQRDPALRRHLITSTKQARVRPTDLWELSSASLKVLPRFLPSGLFTFGPPSGDPMIALQDPIFYRRGELMLGIVSHEQYGVMSITRAERRDVAKAGFPLHESYTF